MFPYPVHWPNFFTAVIYDWLPLLKHDKYKQIIVSSLQYLVKHKRAEVNAFVLMNTHFHIIWQALPGYTPQQLQHAFMKYTAHQIKFELQKDDPALLEKCKVSKPDREYQIWKRNSLNVELTTPHFFNQKLEYIHYNPVVSGLCSYPEEYFYSSANFYHNGIDPFGIVTHFMG